MSFWAKGFIFDDIPSETYNLFISSDSSGSEETDAPNNVELLTETIYRRPTNYLLGVSQTVPLTFPVRFSTDYELTADFYQIIAKWLFGRNSYKKLQIVQYDMEDMYFNCILTDPKLIRVGNILRGISATVVCDSPWGWTYEKTESYSFPPLQVIKDFTFVNLSDDSGYLYPKIDIYTYPSYGTSSLTITNLSDNNRQSSLTTFTPGSEFSIDNNLQVISGTYDSNPLTGVLSIFNKTWFRLLPGNNNIRLNGNCTQFDITYKFARKYGG